MALADGDRRQIDPVRHVANGIDMGIFGLLLGIAVDEAFVVPGDFRVIESEIGKVRRPADAHENAIVEFLARLLIDFHGYFDLLAGSRHLLHLGVHSNFLERLLRGPRHRAGEIWINAREDRRQRLQHDDFAAQSGVHRAQLHADIPAANDQ